jgi:hypothetical protein
MTQDPNNESWLKANVRPLVTLIAFVTISLVIIFQIITDEWLIREYVTWTGAFITFYFGWRSLEGFLRRRK